MQKKSNAFPPSETLLVGIFLTIAGGFLDAYTYLVRGRVFANAQTGNMANFGISIANQDWGKAAFYFVPILSFAVGVYLVQLMRAWFEQHSFLHWKQLVLLVEIVILVITAFVPMGELDCYVNVAVSFVCALQVAAFARLHGSPFATTMCTGNLRTATESLYQSKVQKDKTMFTKSIKYLVIITFFIIGAGIGGACAQPLQAMGTLVPAVCLCVPLVIMHRKEI